MSIKELYDQIGDYDKALKCFGGNEKLLTKFIGRFPSDKNYSHLLQAYEHKDDDGIYRFAVMFLEVCSTLSLTGLENTARVIIEAYHTGEAAARRLYNIPVLMDTLTEQYETVVEAIKTLE